MSRRKLCADEVELVLLEHECDIRTTYDYSEVAIIDKNGMDILKGNLINIEEDEEASNKDLKICQKKIKILLEKYKCRIESTYDYSHVYLISSTGQRLEL